MNGSNIVIMNHSKQYLVLLHIVKYQHANSHDALLRELWLGTTLPWRDYIEHSCCTLRYAVHFFGLVFCSSLQLPLIYAYNQPMFHNPNPSAKSASTEILLVVTGGLSVTTAFEGWNVEVKKLRNTSTSPKLNHARKPAKFNCIAFKGCLSIAEFPSRFPWQKNDIKACLVWSLLHPHVAHCLWNRNSLIKPNDIVT